MLKILDLFSGAGGAAMGYHQAAQELGIPHTITGIDIKPMPRYPFTFIQADALEYLAEHGSEFDFIHASPPCKKWTRQVKHSYPDLIAPTRNLLLSIDKTYAIENVPDAPLIDPLTLCGTMFNLRVFRHRKFETNPKIYFPPAQCNHWGKSDSLGRRKDAPFITVCGSFSNVAKARQAMGIDWMIRDELSQAIPPAYTRYIGLQLFQLSSNR